VKIQGKRRLLLAAGALGATGAVATLVAGATFGFFSATTPTVSNTFTAGTVTLAQSAVTSCTIANIQPGDSGSCGLTVTYNGSVSGGALLGVDLGISSTAAGSPVQAYAPGNTGTTPAAAAGLYDSTANGLQVTISDGSTTYMSGTSWNGAGTTGASPSINDLLVNTAAASAGYAKTFTISWSLPTTANNAYQGAGSTVTVLVHAVQAKNNGSTTGCTPGATCAGITSWS
jgi:hypothetical protein